MSPLTIWTNSRFPQDVLASFERTLASHKLVVGVPLLASNAGTDDPGLSLADVDVAFGQPDVRQIIASQCLRWIHINSASYTRYDRDDVREALARRGAILTTSSGVFREPCAQHVLAMMLALSRQIPQGFDNQAGPRVWPAREMRPRCHLLTGQTAILYGYGSIARRLTELLQPFAMTLLGVRRSPAGDEPIEVVPIDQADERLETADHVINLLPDAPGSRGFFSSERFARMKPSALFYNIGRGATVDQEALLAALRDNRLSAAFLDVTDPEPLPPNHPLWTAPNLHITPHTAGGRSDEPAALIAHFLANFHRFTTGQPLVDRAM